MLTMIRKCKYKEILQKVIIEDGIINIIGVIARTGNPRQR